MSAPRAILTLTPKPRTNLPNILVHTRGDYATLELEMTVDGVERLFAPSDVLTFTVKADLRDADTAAVLQKTSAVATDIDIDIGANTAMIYIQSEDTAALAARVHRLSFDLQLTETATEEIDGTPVLVTRSLTVAQGGFIIEPDVTTGT